MKTALLILLTIPVFAHDDKPDLKDLYCHIHNCGPHGGGPPSNGVPEPSYFATVALALLGGVWLYRRRR